MQSWCKLRKTSRAAAAIARSPSVRRTDGCFLKISRNISNAHLNDCMSSRSVSTAQRMRVEPSGPTVAKQPSLRSWQLVANVMSKRTVASVKVADELADERAAHRSEPPSCAWRRVAERDADARRGSTREGLCQMAPRLVCGSASAKTHNLEEDLHQAADLVEPEVIL